MQVLQEGSADDRVSVMHWAWDSLSVQESKSGVDRQEVIK